jgi:predicted Zn-dependent protease|tara:strand:+ start:2436 stop:3320 length:885 start_codon:yes stop_codon:yes gene_type:complete
MFNILKKRFIILIIAVPIVAISIPVIMQLQLYSPITNALIITDTTTKTSTTILINTTTVTLTSITTITPQNSQSSSEVVSINLVSAEDNKAASWNHTHLKILINLQETLNIDTDYLVVDAVNGAIDQWQRSISEFINIHPEYAYLAEITFSVYVQGVNDTLLQGAPEVEINFAKNLPSSLLGETKLLISSFNSISTAKIDIALSDLSLLGLHNVITHELGHVLGLGHSLIESDLMYYEREKSEVKEQNLCPSTLDIYALALLYHWIETPSYHPYYTTSVTLPDSINHVVLACTK